MRYPVKNLESAVELTIRRLDELLKAIRAEDGGRVGPLADLAAGSMGELTQTIRAAQAMGLPRSAPLPAQDYIPGGWPDAPKRTTNKE